MFAYFVVSLYCIMVQHFLSIVLYCKGSMDQLFCAFVFGFILCELCKREERVLVLYDCLLQIIIVEFRHFVRRVWVSHREVLHALLLRVTGTTV